MRVWRGLDGSTPTVLASSRKVSYLLQVSFRTGPDQGEGLPLYPQLIHVFALLAAALPWNQQIKHKHLQEATVTMALPNKQEIDDLVSSLNDAAKAYSDAPDLNGYMSRVQILEKARTLTNALITPDQKPNYHGLNASRNFAPASWNMVSKHAAAHKYLRSPNWLLSERL